MDKKFYLSCTIDDNWKTCIWQRASKTSHFRYDYTYLNEGNWFLHKEECDSSLEVVKIEGSGEYRKGTKNHECQLHFNSAKDSQEDKWTCSLESCKLPKYGGCKNGTGSGTISKADIYLEVWF